MDAFEKGVWWRMDDDQETIPLEKAPPVWDALGEVGEWVRDAVHDIVYGGGVVWDSYESVDDPKAGSKVRAVLADHLTDPSGWSLGDVTDALQDDLGVTQGQASTIARNEATAVFNVAREQGYEEYEQEVDLDDEPVFDWVGPSDHRTTDLCLEAEQEIEARGGAVPMSELKGILHRLAQAHADDGGTPGRVDEWRPHYNCRRTLVRRSQRL